MLQTSTTHSTPTIDCAAAQRALLHRLSFDDDLREALVADPVRVLESFGLEIDATEIPETVKLPEKDAVRASWMAALAGDDYWYGFTTKPADDYWYGFTTKPADDYWYGFTTKPADDYWYGFTTKPADDYWYGFHTHRGNA